MRIPEAEALKAELAKGAKVPVVLVSGGDDAAREAIVAVVADDLRRAGPVAFERLDASTANTDAWTRLADVAGAIPMFGEGTVVVVEGCKAAEVPPALRDFLQSPPPHARVVLFGERKTGGLAKAVEAAGRVIAPADVRERDASGLAVQAAREAGIAMDGRAARALVDMVGADRSQLSAAIAAFQAYKGKGAKVGEEDLRGLVHRTRQSLPWDLTDAVNDRDLGRALKCAARELEDGSRGAAIPLLHKLARHARQLLIARELVAAGVDDADAAKRMGLKEFPWTKLRDASRRFGRAALIGFLREVPAWEILVKRDGNAPAEAVVLDMLARLIGAGRRA